MRFGLIEAAQLALCIPSLAGALVDVWIDPGHGAIQYIGGNHPGVYDGGAPGANGSASPDEAVARLVGR